MLRVGGIGGAVEETGTGLGQQLQLFQNLGYLPWSETGLPLIARIQTTR
jgi:hypothetical protein